MFSDHTVQSIIALACIDEGVTDAEKDALSRVLSGSRRDWSPACVRYAEAARMLGVSVPTVKRLVKRGALKPIKGTGASALGVTMESVRQFAS